MSLKHFGTDGIRGPYGSEGLNDGIAFRAGFAAVQVAREMGLAERPTIVAGRDTRASGESLLRAFAAGVSRSGGEVKDLGVAPTPCVAFAARESGAHLACVLTASHNPASDNGIKFFQGDGVKPSEALEQALDDAIGLAAGEEYDPSETVSPVSASDLKAAYVEAVVGRFPSGLLAGKRVALDCANGAAFELGPQIFRSLGATVSVVADQPDGANINLGVGSEHPESLAALYSSGKYDMGFAFDGDGDRVILSDETGKRVPGEALLAALALDARREGKLSDATLVTTVQSNLGLDAALKPLGVSVARVDVGDKFIARLMLAEGYSVGGEESGHLVLGDFAVTGDGLFAAAKLAELVCKSGTAIGELTSVYKAFPQRSQAVKVAAKLPLELCANLSGCIQETEKELGENGRLLVRYSGTESKLRLLVEARSEQVVDSSMAALLDAVGKDLELVA